MTRYIDVDSLIDEAKSLHVTLGGVNQITPEGKESILRMMDEQPTADVKPVIHAYWKPVKSTPDSKTKYKAYKCSNGW